MTADAVAMVGALANHTASKHGPTDVLNSFGTRRAVLGVIDAMNRKKSSAASWCWVSTAAQPLDEERRKKGMKNRAPDVLTSARTHSFPPPRKFMRTGGRNFMTIQNDGRIGQMDDILEGTNLKNGTRSAGESGKYQELQAGNRQHMLLARNQI
ncbi:hypothetical protein C8R45DRAFT_942281 [Mycena sanguinolenta]|nr:hypothetical protein C8R45DRAFT_942281 [Mycena sanguinolenta]